LSRADEIFQESGIPHEDLGAAYNYLFASRNPTARKIWEEWRKEYNPHSRKFGIYLTNDPNQWSDSFKVLPESEFEKCAKELDIPEGVAILLPGFISLPKTLEKRKIPPPTIVVWFDGKKGGEFISQMVGSLLAIK
jgi:hypothetical protein